MSQEQNTDKPVESLSDRDRAMMQVGEADVDLKDREITTAALQETGFRGMNVSFNKDFGEVESWKDINPADADDNMLHEITATVTIKKDGVSVRKYTDHRSGGAGKKQGKVKDPDKYQFIDEETWQGMEREAARLLANAQDAEI